MPRARYALQQLREANVFREVDLVSALAEPPDLIALPKFEWVQIKPGREARWLGLSMLLWGASVGILPWAVPEVDSASILFFRPQGVSPFSCEPASHPSLLVVGPRREHLGICCGWSVIFLAAASGRWDADVVPEFRLVIARVIERRQELLALAGRF